MIFLPILTHVPQTDCVVFTASLDQMFHFGLYEMEFSGLNQETRLHCTIKPRNFAERYIRVPKRWSRSLRYGRGVEAGRPGHA